MVGSFFDPVLEEGCAFEELISFHGGLGGPQTRPFVMHPPHLVVPDEPLIGAAAVHRLLLGWRTELQDTGSPPAGPALLDPAVPALPGVTTATGAASPESVRREPPAPE